MKVMNVTKKLFSLTLAAMLATMLCACGSSAQTGASAGASEGLVPMTLSFSTWVGSGPFYIARDKGFFKEHGIDCNIKIVEDESTYASLMGSGSIDALGHVIDREVINYSKGVGEKVVMVYDQSSGGDGIVVSKDITKPEDLKGKTIALNKSSTSYFYFLTVIDKAGLKESDMTIKDMDADSAGTAFVQGQVDAAVTWEPWLTNANQREGGHLLCSSADYPDTIVDDVAFTDAFIKAHPDTVKGFVEAWDEAVAWYKDGHQDEGDKIMAAGLNIKIDDFKSQVKGVTWYDKASMAAFYDKSKENSIYGVADRAIKFWTERKLIDKSFDSADFVTDEYLDK